jgi:transcriptional regulator with XRE-family HTH domain
LNVTATRSGTTDRRKQPIGATEYKRTAGDELRRLREERGLRPIDIQSICDHIKLRKNREDFGISHATLNEIETQNSLPNVRKMFSLAACLRVPLEQILELYDVSPRDVSQYYEEQGGSPVQVVPPSFAPQSTNIFDLRRTQLLIFDRGQGTAPPDGRLGPTLDLSAYSYGWVGTDDDTMANLVPPGSMIEIDRKQCTIEVDCWSAVRERPIYFCWTKQGYRCSWCEEAKGELVLLPSPASVAQTERYRIPRDARLIGRVRYAWIPFGAIRDNSDNL